MSGEADFLVAVVVPDLAGYEAFLVGTLLKMPMIKDIRGSFAIRTVKATAPLLLGHLTSAAQSTAATAAGGHGPWTNAPHRPSSAGATGPVPPCSRP